jgi:tetratricopeptide (TPR) repeat protein
LIRRAIAANPNVGAFHNNLGNALNDAGRSAEAVEAYRAAARLKPGVAEIFTNLGNSLLTVGRTDEAIEALQESARLRPNPDLHNRIGNLLHQRGQPNEAAVSYRAAIQLKPDSPEAHNNLGVVLQSQSNLAEAEQSFRRAILIASDFSEAHGNLGNVLREQGQIESALAEYEIATHIQPQNPKSHLNQSAALAGLGRVPEALAACNRALALAPDSPDAHWTRSLMSLLLGDLEAGWRDYEWRWQTEAYPCPKRNFPQSQWDGSDLQGRSILLHAEQGLGDTIQFIRYASLVASRNPRSIIVECHPLLLALLRTVPGVTNVIARGEPLPPFDVHSPLLSLPAIFQTRLDTIPAAVPYLFPDESRKLNWKPKLATATGLKVGITWAGNPAHRNDRNRSIPFAELHPLATLSGVTFISLQKGPAADQSKNPSTPLHLADHTAALTDFLETAALIMNLDLVISVDTSVAHLAGALGKPVWLLLPFAPDWRWMLHRDDSPWYTTMQLFRQTSPGDWRNVVQRIASLLPQKTTATP